MSVASGNEKDNISMEVLTNIIIKLEKLQEDRIQAVKTTSIQQWNITLWSQHKNTKKQFNSSDYALWFLKGNNSHLGKFNRKWFGLYRVQYVLPNNIVLLVTVEKFETGPILVMWSSKLKI